MNAVVIERPFSRFDRHALDHALAIDAAAAQRRTPDFAPLSDLELACAYQAGGEHTDAMYCELHLRQLTPWKLVERADATEVPR